jgi:hypothetical protein
MPVKLPQTTAADPRSFPQASPSSAPSIPTPTAGAFVSFSAPDPSFALLLPGAALLALTFILVDPLLSRALLPHFPASRQVSSGWPIALSSTLFVGYVGFGRGTSLAEMLVGGVAWTGELHLPLGAPNETDLSRSTAISHLVSSDPRSVMGSSSFGSVTTSASREPLLARLSTFYRHLRATVKTILATPDSRKIYFFLCLNLAFMFVQMAYGIWTNSLGLISDCEQLGRGAEEVSKS